MVASLSWNHATWPPYGDGERLAGDRLVAPVPAPRRADAVRLDARGSEQRIRDERAVCARLRVKIDEVRRLRRRRRADAAGTAGDGVEVACELRVDRDDA